MSTKVRAHAFITLGKDAFSFMNTWTDISYKYIHEFNAFINCSIEVKIKLSYPGKLCLQHEDVAKKCVAALARELEVSTDPVIRNNVVIIMADLCVR